IWWTAPAPDDLQEVYARFRRTGLGRASEPVWSVMALHRPAEFNKGHIPAFLAGEEPRAYACVYPFVRSYECYLLDPAHPRPLSAVGWPANPPTSAPTRWPASRSTTRSGCSASKRTSCTGSWT